MEKGVLERFWCGPESLRDHKVIGGVFEEIQKDVRSGCVFPALRENAIDLYYAGGRMLRVGPRSARSHLKYVKGCGSREHSFSAITSNAYRGLKEKCAEHNESDRHSERWLVSRLFPRFSAWCEDGETGPPRLIDVEVRLRAAEAQMIDLLLLGGDRRLTFVEVKREYDGRVRSTGTPEVVKQVKRYEDTIRRDRGVNRILLAYGNVREALSSAFELCPFEEPREVFGRVPILVCRERRRGRQQDTWLRPRLQRCLAGEIDPEYLVVDGGGTDRAVEHPPWCSGGLWENLNLKVVFEKLGRLNAASDG